MIEYKDYAKLENLTELSDAMQMGMDIEFTLNEVRYNISWRDGKPFICECPEGEAVFYEDVQSMLSTHQINNKTLETLWKDMEILSM